MNPSLGIDASGAPFVAWEQAGPPAKNIMVRRWDGTDWAELDGSGSGGGISNSPVYSGRPSVAVDSSGGLLVAWQEAGEIFLKRWNGTVWTAVGSSSAGSGISGSPDKMSARPSLAAGGGSVVVAWEEAKTLTSSTGDEIYVRGTVADPPNPPPTPNPTASASSGKGDGHTPVSFCSQRPASSIPRPAILAAILLFPFLRRTRTLRLA